MKLVGNENLEFEGGNLWEVTEEREEKRGDCSYTYNPDESRSLVYEDDDYIGSAVSLYFRDIRRYPLLSEKEERQLFWEYKYMGNEEARKRLIECNLRFVAWLAKKYKNCGVDYLELINEGNEGLMKAIEKFELSKETRFLTYASDWIEVRISRAIKNYGGIIRLPINVRDELNSYLKLKERKLLVNNKVSYVDISDKLGISVEKVEKYENLLAILPYVSIYQKTGTDYDESGVELIDIIADTESVNPEHEYVDMSLFGELRKAIDYLPAQEKWAILVKFGFLDGNAKSSEETARELAKFGITDGLTSRQNVDQHVARGLKKLKKGADFKTHEFDATLVEKKAKRARMKSRKVS